MFQFDQGLFPAKHKEPNPFRRSSEREYKITEKYLKGLSKGPAEEEVDPERVLNILKKLPPFALDN